MWGNVLIEVATRCISTKDICMYTHIYIYIFMLMVRSGVRWGLGFRIQGFADHQGLLAIKNGTFFVIADHLACKCSILHVIRTYIST